MSDDAAETAALPAASARAATQGRLWPPLTSEAKTHMRALLEPLLRERPSSAPADGVVISLDEPAGRLTAEQIRLVWWAKRYLLAPVNLSARVAAGHPHDHVVLSQCGLGLHQPASN